MYFIQHYMISLFVSGLVSVVFSVQIKFVSDLWQVCGFLYVLYTTLYDQVCQLTCGRSVSVYSMLHYMIKFVSDLWQVCGFLCVLYTTLYDQVVSDLCQVCGFLCVLYTTYDQVCQ